MSTFTISRRRFLAAAGALAALAGGHALGAPPPKTATPVASPQATASPTAAPTAAPTPYLLQADAPAWAFILETVQDPYTGKLIFPSNIGADNRVVRADVMIINNADQPLDFQPSNVRMLDTEGVEYGAGNAQGSEPRLVGQPLTKGQRSRGSVWFIVPANARLVAIKFYGPTPLFQVPLGKGR